MNDIDKILKARCKHFTGLQHDQCAAGVAYRSFPNWDLPCRQEVEGPSPCPFHEWHTIAEIDEHEAAVGRALMKWLADLKADICPHCGTAIEKKQQIGRCVYASPCGCRLYQGKLKEQS